MKKTLIFFVLFFLSLYISAQPFRPDVPCKDGLNLLPMYGNMEKCAQQLKLDSEFLSNCDREYSDRKTACEAHLEMGWKYMHQGDNDTAMKRFNQAWLLDKKNPVVYSSFGWALSKRGQNNNAVTFFEKSIEMGSDDDKVLALTASGYIEMYKKWDDKKYCKRAVELLHLGLKINPDNRSIQQYLKETDCN
ncbi:MAG: tetratricopeptide repeat protein [Dysgonomonas sp.]